MEMNSCQTCSEFLKLEQKGTRYTNQGKINLILKYFLCKLLSRSSSDVLQQRQLRLNVILQDRLVSCT